MIPGAFEGAEAPSNIPEDYERGMLMSSFYDLFLTRNVPESLQFRILTIPYFVYLLITVFLTFLFFRYFERVGADKAKRAIKGLSLFLLFIFFFRIYTDYVGDWDFDLVGEELPFHLCLLACFVLPFALFTGNELLMNFSYTLLLPSAVAAMLMPTGAYNQYCYFGWFTISFYIHHGLVVMIPILAIKAKIFTPDKKYIPKMIGMAVVYAIFIFFLNKLLGANYMFLNTPSAGSIMVPLAKVFGNPGYVAPIVLIGIIAMLLMNTMWAGIRRRRVVVGDQ